METETSLLPSVLVIEDDAELRLSFRFLLEDNYRVYGAESGEEGLRTLQQEDINIVLLDLGLPDMDGMEVLREVRAIDENVNVIVVTAQRDVSTVVEAMKLGAHDYLAKPLDENEVLALLQRTLEHRNLVREVMYLRSEVDRHRDMGNIIGNSPMMLQIYDLVCHVADTNATVLISGESGTGKELIAQAIHRKSPRSNKPFVAVNCAAISESLIESELFGHERGAFTGAVERHMGKFELADTGVLFLDEIGSLRLDMQAKLLRVLQEREFERVGGSKTIRVDVRIVAAANEDLKQMMQEKMFRDDLYYRLNVIAVQMPPLRDRKSDIPLLAEHFLVKYNTEFNRQIQGISSAAMSSLAHYSWPGNVRELENVIERLVAIGSKGIIGMDDLPLDLTSVRDRSVDYILNAGHTLREARDKFERQYILKALEKCHWNQTETAKGLGIHRNTLLGKMDSLTIRHDADSGPDSGL